MDDQPGVFGSFFDPRSGYYAVFEDDGRVAYAYVLNPQQKFVADVWLYNRCETPVEPEWTDPSKLPFANPLEYVKSSEDIAAVENISEVTVEREHSQDGRATAYIFIRGRLVGRLAEGDQPGASFLAACDGPLANVLK